VTPKKEKQLCVFCGEPPNDKTKEHVVPHWLLELTGDPARVVPLGRNYESDKIIQFSWSNFVAPACEACNNRFSQLEARVKPHVEALTRREAITVSAYVDLLDWLDKVRVGVWLTLRLIQKHPMEIQPNFRISSRVAEKDRMVAVYVFDSKIKGINLFGTDSLIFHGMPSCFGLRINNILLFNVSSDFFCSKGCGLPYPTSAKLQMGGQDAGRLKLGGFSYAAEISDPITDLQLYRPIVWLYQPIKWPTDDPMYKGGYLGHTNLYDSRISARTLDGNKRQGALFRQYKGSVTVLKDPSLTVDFDEVIGSDCAKQQDIAASVYEVQAALFGTLQHEWIEPPKPSVFDEEYRKAKLASAAALGKMYREAKQ
jgi:hypothetical protein